MTHYQLQTKSRDHGGNLDHAIDTYGGSPKEWIDLSTGINPVAYPTERIDPSDYHVLPRRSDLVSLENVARSFWNVPEKAQVIATNGASAAIAALPFLLEGKKVSIPRPTYNEHLAAFENAGWCLDDTTFDVQVFVHPNNPTGKIWSADAFKAPIVIVDESFGDVIPDTTLIKHSAQSSRIFIKSFGKFWGLAGLRVGFVIGADPVVSKLRELLGPWPVGGGAIKIATKALSDKEWVAIARSRLKSDAIRLDKLMTSYAAKLVGGCDLFRLYDVTDANLLHEKLANHHIWSRIFPYSKSYIRLGLPAPADWTRLERVLAA
jgi:cobalamin biosynthetic protein CobC